MFLKFVFFFVFIAHVPIKKEKKKKLFDSLSVIYVYLTHKKKKKKNVLFANKKKTVATRFCSIQANPREKTLHSWFSDIIRYWDIFLKNNRRMFFYSSLFISNHVHLINEVRYFYITFIYWNYLPVIIPHYCTCYFIYLVVYFLNYWTIIHDVSPPQFHIIFIIIISV